MTADDRSPVAAGVPAATGLRLDLFLLAGQFPPADHQTSLRRAVTYARAARRGQPLLLGMHDDDAAKAAMLDRYTDTAAHAGHDAGTTAHASAHLAYVADTGVDRPLLMVEGAGDPDLTCKNVARLGDEVLPALRRLRATVTPTR